MTPFLPKFTSTRSVAFLNVSVSLNDKSSPLHLQKKANSPTTFSKFFFFHLISFKAPQNLKIVEGNQNQSGIRPSSYLLKQIQRPSMEAFVFFTIKGIFYGACLQLLYLKNTPMEISWFLMLYVIHFGHVLNM